MNLVRIGWANHQSLWVLMVIMCESTATAPSILWRWLSCSIQNTTNPVVCCDTAFRSGAVMGFLLTSLGLLVIFATIKIFKVVSTPVAPCIAAMEPPVLLASNTWHAQVPKCGGLSACTGVHQLLSGNGQAADQPLLKPEKSLAGIWQRLGGCV